MQAFAGPQGTKRTSRTNKKALLSGSCSEDSAPKVLGETLCRNRQAKEEVSGD